MSRFSPPTRPQAVPAKHRIPANEGLRRERLLTLLGDVWSHRLCLVVAPAGCGKTTLLSQFAATSTSAVGWYRAEPCDGDTEVFLAHLESSARRAIGDVDGPWFSAGDAARALEAVGRRLLLVIDDLHALGGTAAELELERLLGYLPDGVSVLAASRAHPRMNISRLRVSGELIEVGQDALRFRCWEVEHLFRDVYDEPLRPEDLAELARRTEGWAAGLQLFHLATRGKAADDRRRTLRALAGHSRLVREYLARNVLNELDVGVRTFLLRTSVLGRLNGHLCDRLLDRDGSDAVLAELQHQQLFTDLLDEGGWYRYHAVLRSHLETMAVEEMGEAAVREQRRRGGALLENEGAFAEALEAYCSAGAWEEAAGLLGVRGEELVAGPGSWIELLPSAMFEENPWVLLAAARWHLATGRCRAALDAYRRAETAFGDMATAELCRRERASLAAWTEASVNLSAGWSGLLRAATRRDPMVVSTLAAQSSEASHRLVAGLAALLAGRVDEARRGLLELLGREDLAPAAGVCARLGAALATTLGPTNPVTQARRLIEDVEHTGFPWLDQLARAVVAATGQDPSMPETDGTDAEDRWGPALRSLLIGWGEVRHGDGDPDRLGRIAAVFANLDASVLEAWAYGLLALAQRQRGLSAASATADRARAIAERVGVPGAGVLALAAGGDEGERRMATALAEECGLDLPQVPAGEPLHEVRRRSGGQARSTQWVAPSLAITCLGRFTLTLNGSALDLGMARPKVRSLLRLLALHAWAPLHRDVIAGALWPEADADAGRRNLQVAVSAVRRLLETQIGSASGIAVLRDGESYRLVLPEDSEVDLTVFRRSLTSGHQRRQAGDLGGAIHAFEEAVVIAENDLFPEEGPADWLIVERERLAADLVGGALALASLHSERGDVVSAAAACERALRIDRYADAAWDLLVEIHRRAGNQAAGTRARRRYAAVLRELGFIGAEPARP